MFPLFTFKFFKVQLPIPTMPAYAAAPMVDPKIVFRAIRVMRASDLNLDLWNLAIEEKEKIVDI